MTNTIDGLRDHLAEIEDLGYSIRVLGWDQQTMMPPHGAGARADALATLERLSHERFISDRTGTLLDAAERAAADEPWQSDDASLVRVTRRRWEKARRVPSELAGELARAASLGQEAWVKAREQSNYASFAPYLARNLELAREYVDCFKDYGSYECAYDALLDDYEPGMRTSEVERVFRDLRAQLVPLISTLAEHWDVVDVSCLHGSFAIPVQRQLVAEVTGLMGFDPEGWRMDDAVHPFATSFGASDVRITTRWDEAYYPSGLYGAMHECGHGLYEAGVASALARTPLGHVESLGMHESQSRLWENMVGRGRSFSTVLAPRIGELFGGSLSGLDPDALYRAVNRVEPSFIRVEADEATYGLHIVLRFELEQELIEGRLSVDDLPDAWNRRFRDYVGLDIRDDADGVLQDVHWSAGLIGYFPTYALGNLIAGQLWARAHTDLPDLEEQIARGQLMPLREWLREHVHRHGAKFTTRELLDQVVGGPIEVDPFVSYLKAKLSDVYGVAL